MRWDDSVLRDVMRSIDDDGETITDIGFADNEIKRILQEPDDLEVREIETAQVEDEFWISIRGPLAEQANALKALREAMRPFAGVTVEQGTIDVG